MKNEQYNLSNLENKAYILDADKLVTVPVNLSKLSGVETNGIIKKDVYNAKIKNFEDKRPNIANLATNATPNAQINDVKKEIHSITKLATTTALSAIIKEVKNKIPNITNLTITTTLTDVENKIPYQGKYIITTEFNKLTVKGFAAKLT